jgi:cellulose synthase/poly-beta-1,6-N-acetylglucosamine synthase-like glycosyltransferase
MGKVIPFKGSYLINLNNHFLSQRMFTLYLLLCLFTLLYMALLILFRLGWKRVNVWEFPKKFPRNTTVTVVVVARNEEQRIGPLLACLSKQNYPSNLMEIVVVDDHSEDLTASMVEAYVDQGIKLLRLSDLKTNEILLSPKKKGIAYAIGETSGALIVTTDADCSMRPDWISSIVERYETSSPDMMVMPVRMIGGKGLSAWFQSLDFLMLQIITTAFQGLGKPVMCNGANLAYTRKAYESVGGFSGNEHLASGDDLFLLHKITERNKRSVIYHLSKSVVVDTLPELGWIQFFRQRIRWGAKTRHYKDGRLIPVLVLVYGFNVMLMMMGLLITVYFFQGNPAWRLICEVLLISVFIKIFAEMILMIPAARFYDLQKKLLLFPFLQPLHIAYTVFAGVLSQIGSFKWKGRTLR